MRRGVARGRGISGVGGGGLIHPGRLIRPGLRHIGLYLVDSRHHHSPFAREERGREAIRPPARGGGGRERRGGAAGTADSEALQRGCSAAARVLAPALPGLQWGLRPGLRPEGPAPLEGEGAQAPLESCGVLAGFKGQVTARPAVVPVWQAWPVSVGPVAVLLHCCLCCLAKGLEQT